MNIVWRILILCAFVLVVDGIWLRLQRAMYRKTIRETQKKEMRLRMAGAAWSYGSIILLMVLFAEAFHESRGAVAIYAFVYGALIYGVFNGTNVAIFSEYSTRTAVVDTLWGGVLFAAGITLYKELGV